MKTWKRPSLNTPNHCACGAGLNDEHDAYCPFPLIPNPPKALARVWIAERVKIIEASERAIIPPTVPELSKFIEWDQLGTCEATDGCIVALNGICEHGYSSWFIVLGLVKREDEI